MKKRYICLAYILILIFSCNKENYKRIDDNVLSNVKENIYAHDDELNEIDIDDKTFNNDLFNRDKNKFLEIFPLFLEIKDIDTYINTYNFNRHGETLKRELGLGYSIITLIHPGGWYTARSLEMLVNSDYTIIINKISLNGSIDAITMLIDEYDLLNIENIIFSETEYNHYYIVKEYYNDSLYSKFINDYKNYFNYKNEIIIPDEIISEYQLLTEPFNKFSYGYIMGYSGDTKTQRIAFNKILELKNKNILFSILTSPNPEGRIFAIEGLQRLNVNRNEYVNILKKIVDMKLLIDNSDGCFGSMVLVDSENVINKIIEIY